jgi:D-serine deaminase-like pyridoxal phosphate-dependent protein
VQPLTSLTKGFTGVRAGAPVTPQDLVTAGARLTDPPFGTPLMVLRESALGCNIGSMARFCAGSGVLLAPHAKTTMSPEIFTRQLAAGAWALTAANPTQAALYAHFGARRILIANEVADPAGIALLIELLATVPGLELCCYADSTQGVRALEAGAERAPAALGRPIPVLLEYGVDGGRTGVRSREEALAVAGRIRQSSSVALIGVSCFEGVLGHGTDEHTLSSVAGLCATVRELGEELAEGGYIRHGIDGRPAAAPSLILSAGGSHFFDVVAREFRRSRVPATDVVLRSGSYVAHDHGVYLGSTPALRDPALPAFNPAIEIHATVLSRPQPDLVLLNAGRRDVPFDAGLPVVLGPAGAGGVPAGIDHRARVTGLNDQHAFVAVPPSSPLGVGDRVVLGISHPCTTFDKWQAAVIADDHDRVTGIAHTFF